ncbi:MAG TPA: hypothetical protein VGJ78_04405 [Vicinamibacterales bacterium]|jgi:hypothetical protein
MTRTLTFGPCTDQATNQPSACCKKFALFVNLFIAGGNLLHFNPSSGPTSRTPEERRQEAKVVRAWKAISDETGPDGARKLKTDGGTLTFDQPTFALVEKYLAAAPGGTQDADVIDDLLDWVSAADKAE